MSDRQSYSCVNRRSIFRSLSLLSLLVFLFIFSLFSHGAQAGQANLAWDPNTDLDLAGYKVYLGNASGNYQSNLDVGNKTSAMVTNLQEGATYYFAVTAYDSSRNESEYSNEVAYTIPAACTYSVSPVSQSFNSTGGTGSEGVTTPSGCSWTALSNASWIMITSNASATGSGTTYYSVSPNSGTSSRTGALTIAGKVVTISQSGASTQYSLNITKAGTGSGAVTNTPSGSTFNAGTSVTLTAAPAANSTFAGWSGACSGSASTCTITMNANASVTATFNIKSYTITATAGPNGTISPQGTVSISPGANQSFTITPNSGYKIADVKVDGASVGTIASYSFTNVTGNHTIAATFATNTSYSLTVTKAGTGSGTVTNTPSGSTFNAGTSVTLTATPAANSTFAGWFGANIGTSSTCTITMNANASVTATFNLKAYTITATAGANGAISPQGTVSVGQGANQSFTITPNSGYKIADIKVDGASVGAVTSFLFGAVTSNHTIDATFSSLNPQAASPVYGLNAGGAPYMDKAGVSYIADKYYQGGRTGRTYSAIAGTEDDTLYKTERYGNFSYSVPVPNGNYLVNFKFAENHWSSPNRRIFNVEIEGQQVITNLDIFAKVGKNRAYDVSIPVSVNDGVLRIDFISVKDKAKISAISIQKVQ